MTKPETNEGSLWGARFASGPSPELAALSKSTHFDWQLYPYDIAGSRAHASALAAAGYLDADELARMRDGLDRLEAAVDAGEVVAGDADEDVHGALESALIAIVGPELGGKLRAGRSRNDQIATLVRLYLLDHAAVISHRVVQLIDAIASQAAAHPDANIIFGANIDEELDDQIWITVVATRFDGKSGPTRRPAESRQSQPGSRSDRGSGSPRSGGSLPDVNDVPEFLS